jgi:lysozyme
MTGPRLPDPSLPWPIHEDAVALIAQAEGCRLKAYRCPAGVATCGWGETDGVCLGMTWTQEEADRRFCDSLADYTDRVRAMLTEHATPAQLGALVSLAYNIGLGAFGKSTVLRQHNAGRFDAAARAFSLWNKARVKGVLTELAGLTSRRAAEASLYLRHDDDEPHIRMPQAVAPESSIAASPIVRAGATTAGAGLVTGLGTVQEHAGQVSAVTAQLQTIAGHVGVAPQALLAVVLVVAGGAAMWWRYRQRADGWA